MIAVGGVNSDVTEAAALAHDLGHPPFGQIAEDELKRLAEQNGLADGFEGNPQSFRIITALSLRREGFAGLNLTRATMNAVLKYPWFRETSGYRQRKWGTYRSEAEDFCFARAFFEPGDEKKSAEAEIMDWSDDIAYAVHDMEDFYRAGLIPLDRLAIDEDERERFFQKTFDRWDEEKEKVEHDREDLRSAFKEILELVPDPIREPYEGTKQQRAALRSLTSLLIGRYSKGVKLKVPDSQDKGRLARQKDMVLELRMLKELTWTYVIRNPRLATQQHGQRRIVEELFHIFLSAAKSAKTSDRTIFPVPYREQLDELEDRWDDKESARARSVIDLIAGMTEQAAIDMYRRLTGISSGSVTDVLLR